MPELPEVEHVRRTLERALIGRVVRRVTVNRREYIRGEASASALLKGSRIDRLVRRGKQLAIVASCGRVVCVHLGMSGQALVSAGGDAATLDHVHLEWRLDDGRTASLRDPRRFGGVWTFPTLERLMEDRWAALGPDALEIDAQTLVMKLRRTSRAVKPALMDQSLLAGLGNIYCDEALHRAGISPATPSARIGPARADRLLGAIRETLGEAIDAGGSSVRDYRDANGDWGVFQLRHRVYGRGGDACLVCGRRLRRESIGQRTTVWCSRCQR